MGMNNNVYELIMTALQTIIMKMYIQIQIQFISGVNATLYTLRFIIIIEIIMCACVCAMDFQDSTVALHVYICYTIINIHQCSHCLRVAIWYC